MRAETPVPQPRERYPKPSFDVRLAGRFTDLIEEGIDVAVLRRARGRQPLNLAPTRPASAVRLRLADVSDQARRPATFRRPSDA